VPPSGHRDGHSVTPWPVQARPRRAADAAASSPRPLAPR
jgi:hypothetical protein